MYFADDFVINYTLTFFYLLEGKFTANIFRFGSNYCSLVSLGLVCLNLSELGWLGHLVDRLKFAVVVDSDFSRRGPAQIFHDCFIHHLFHVDRVHFILLFCSSVYD